MDKLQECGWVTGNSANPLLHYKSTISIDRLFIKLEPDVNRLGVDATETNIFNLNQFSFNNYYNIGDFTLEKKEGSDHNMFMASFKILYNDMHVGDLYTSHKKKKIRQTEVEIQFQKSALYKGMSVEITDAFLIAFRCSFKHITFMELALDSNFNFIQRLWDCRYYRFIRRTKSSKEQGKKRFRAYIGDDDHTELLESVSRGKLEKYTFIFGGETKQKNIQ